MIIIEGHRIPGGDSEDGLRPLTLNDCRNYREGILSRLMDAETLIGIMADEIERLNEAGSLKRWSQVGSVILSEADYQDACDALKRLLVLHSDKSTMEMERIAALIENYEILNPYPLRDR